VTAHTADTQDAATQAHPDNPDRSHARDGVWKVVTETSTHLIDYDTMMVTRIAGAGGGAVPDLPAPTLNALRRDHDPVPLIEAPEPVVGQRLVMVLAIRDDGTATWRRTTIVRSIERVTPDPADTNAEVQA
jgi:hypothetical protein